jgi:hypothetical protein
VADSEELNEIIAEDFDEAILEACAEQADEAIEAGLEARKLFELKAAANTRLCLGQVDEFRRRIQGDIRWHS